MEHSPENQDQIDLEAFQSEIRALKEEEEREGKTAKFSDINPDDLTKMEMLMYKRVLDGKFDDPDSGFIRFAKLKDKLSAGASYSRRKFYAYLSNLLMSRMVL